MIKMKVSFFTAIMAIALFSCQNNVQENEKATSGSIMPGAKIYDVTKPETWGGDPSMAATPDDPSDDDGAAINAALQAAADFIDSIKVAIDVSFWEKYPREVYQQLVYLPPGTYHLETPVIFPATDAHPERWKRKERYIWLYGEGEHKTILQLKPATEIGELGTSSEPKPVVQVVQYDPETYQGNDNFQLYVTDLSIMVPADQPNVIGLSYGMANLGSVTNVSVKAEGDAGFLGFALVQRNTGPGLIENLTVEGFDKGIEIIDPWGEGFTFSNIMVKNQNPGGIGISVADKQIGIENFVSQQDQSDVVPVLLHDDKYYNTQHGGFPHLTLLNADISSTVESTKPAVLIERGHIYIRNLKAKGYGNELIVDHGTKRKFNKATIDEYVSVHGKTDQEKDNVIYTVNEAPEKSLMLPVKPTPKIPEKVFDKFNEGDYRLVSQNDLKNGQLNIKTSWVIIDPAKSGDDTKLLQAAINSGAKYVGLLNTEPFLISETIFINDDESKNVEIIFGYLSEIHVDAKINQRKNPAEKNDGVLFHISSGNADKLFIKGLRFTSDNRKKADFTLFHNNAAQTVIIEEIRCKDASISYRNGKESHGQKVFFHNVDLNYFGDYPDVLLKIDNQKVWARQFDIERLLDTEKEHTNAPLVINNGGQLWVFSQKYGEHNGVYVQTENGGKTELLSVFFNAARTNDLQVYENTTNFVVKGAGSEFSMTGQERIRVHFNEEGIVEKPLPNKNKFGVIINGSGDTTVIKATSLPTYLKYEGVDPFNDTDYELMQKKNHYRVAGLIRINN